MSTQFDKYFLNLPPLTKESDFDQFWKKNISEIKKIPIKPEITHDKKKSTGKFKYYSISFISSMKSTITGTLLIPNKVDKPKVIIHIHDYNNLTDISQKDLNIKNAYFFLTMRGHDNIIIDKNDKIESPGYMIEHIMDIDTYYVKAVYLDLYRSIDLLRLIPDLDCNSIGIFGKGLGASAAIFVAVFSKRISAIVLDSPFFCELEKSQNLSTSFATKEINDFIPLRKGKKKQIKTNLTYFDALNFSELIKCPILTIIGLKDTIAPPACGFALFNHFLCEKKMEIHPNDDNKAGGEKQFIESLNWLSDRI